MNFLNPIHYTRYLTTTPSKSDAVACQASNIPIDEHNKGILSKSAKPTTPTNTCNCQRAKEYPLTNMPLRVDC